MATLTRLKVTHDQNDVVLFTATINGKEKQCIATKLVSGSIFNLRIIKTGLDITSTYWWGGRLLENVIKDLIKSGLKEWDLNLKN